MPDNSKWQLMLASASPRRRELLSLTGVNFTVQTAHSEEISIEKDPALFALDIARQKGHAVTNRFGREQLVVISADTVVAHEQCIFGKPLNRLEAERFLRHLAGRTHCVHTALVLRFKHQQHWQELSHVQTTYVEFAEMDEPWLSSYLASGDSLDKAGAYGIQSGALRMVKSIRGCYANVVGFPLARFNMLMQQLQHEVSKEKRWQDLFA